MPMILNILFYCVTRDFISDCSNKISIFPKFSTPQFSLHFWISKKYLLGAYTFENSYYLSNRVFWRDAREYMHMVFSYLHLFYLTISGRQYLFKQFFNCFLQFIIYSFPIFRGPYKMITSFIYCMAQSLKAHATYYTNYFKYCNPFLPVLPHGVSRVVFS